MLWILYECNCGRSAGVAWILNTVQVEAIKKTQNKHEKIYEGIPRFNIFGDICQVY